MERELNIKFLRVPGFCVHLALLSNSTLVTQRSRKEKDVRNCLTVAKHMDFPFYFVVCVQVCLMEASLPVCSCLPVTVVALICSTCFSFPGVFKPTSASLLLCTSSVTFLVNCILCMTGWLWILPASCLLCLPSVFWPPLRLCTSTHFFLLHLGPWVNNGSFETFAKWPQLI